jgi:hypothetical protein
LYAADAPGDRVCRQYSRVLNRLRRPEVVSAGSTANSLDGDRAILFLRAPPRWTPGRFASLTARRVFSISADRQGDIQAENLDNSRQIEAPTAAAKLVEFSLKLTLASWSVILYARGRGIPRVPK